MNREAGQQPHLMEQVEKPTEDPEKIPKAEYLDHLNKIFIVNKPTNSTLKGACVDTGAQMSLSGLKKAKPLLSPRISAIQTKVNERKAPILVRRHNINRLRPHRNSHPIQ